MAMDDDLDPRSLAHKPPEPTRVGDTIYRFDINNRVYRDQTPSGGGGPIYAKHFIPYLIVGEVALSWVLSLPDHRVGKRELRRIGPQKAWFTESQMQDCIWDNENRYPIIEVLRHTDVAKLREVARMLDYKPKPAE